MQRTERSLGWIIIVALAGIALALAVTAPARAAGDTAAAKQHFRRGVELFKDGDYEQAVIAFERAYELKPTYKLFWNIAQVEAELKHYSRALEAYTRYLTEGGDRVPRERVQKAKAEIGRLNTLVGSIAVECPIDGALVLVDKRRVGTTPLAEPVFVDIGEHEVAVKRGADELHAEVLRVAGGERVVVEVPVSAKTAAPAPAEAAAAPAQSVPPEPEPLGKPEVDPTEEEGPKRVWTWVALGIGGAALASGAVIGGVAMGKRKDLAEECDGDSCPEGKAGEADRIRTMNTTADVLYGVTAAAVVVGSVLFFVEPDDDEEEIPAAEVTLAPLATPRGGGLAVEGRF